MLALPLAVGCDLQFKGKELASGCWVELGACEFGGSRKRGMGTPVSLTPAKRLNLRSAAARSNVHGHLSGRVK